MPNRFSAVFSQFWSEAQQEGKSMYSGNILGSCTLYSVHSHVACARNILLGECAMWLYFGPSTYEVLYTLQRLYTCITTQFLLI